MTQLWGSPQLLICFLSASPSHLCSSLSSSPGPPRPDLRPHSACSCSPCPGESVGRLREKVLPCFVSQSPRGGHNFWNLAGPFLQAGPGVSCEIISCNLCWQPLGLTPLFGPETRCFYVVVVLNREYCWQWVLIIYFALLPE